MPTRSMGPLGALEAQLAAVTAHRQTIIAQMQAAAARLTGMMGTPTRTRATQPRPRRRLSAAARRRLSLAASRRWAEAKKAGKTRLG